MATDPRTPLLYPGPYDPFGRRRPETPDAPRPFEVKFPPSPDPVIRSVFRNNVRSLADFAMDVFPWPRAGPLSVQVTNTLNQAVTVEVHVSAIPDNTRLNDESALAFDVAANGGRRTETLNPEAGDDWGPFAFGIVRPAAIPTSGEVNVVFSRPG